MSGSVAPAYVPSQRARMTPSLSAILAAYERDGDGDKEVLLAILNTKRLEDERLASLDRLRSEEFRYASVQALAIHAHHTQQFSQGAVPDSESNAAYSSFPPSPPLSSISSRVGQDDISDDEENCNNAKRARTNAYSAHGPTPPHNVVMTALRSKLAAKSNAYNSPSTMGGHQDKKSSRPGPGAGPTPPVSSPPVSQPCPTVSPRNSTDYSVSGNASNASAHSQRTRTSDVRSERSESR